MARSRGMLASNDGILPPPCICQTAANGHNRPFAFGPRFFLGADTRDSRRRILPPYVNALLRQVHLLEYCLEARIAVQAIEQQVDFDL